MRDAERAEIGHDGRGRVEAELRRELQAIGGDWNGGVHQHGSRHQNTDHGRNTSPGGLPQMPTPLASQA